MTSIPPSDPQPGPVRRTPDQVRADLAKFNTAAPSRVSKPSAQSNSSIYEGWTAAIIIAAAGLIAGGGTIYFGHKSIAIGIVAGAGAAIGAGAAMVGLVVAGNVLSGKSGPKP